MCQCEPLEFEFLEHAPAVHVGFVEQRESVEVQHVEDHVGDAHALVGGDALPSLEAHALLQRLEGRASAGIEADDLAVEHDAPCAECSRKPSQLGIAPGHVEAVAAHQRERSALDS